MSLSCLLHSLVSTVSPDVSNVISLLLALPWLCSPNARMYRSVCTMLCMGISLSFECLINLQFVVRRVVTQHCTR